MLYQIVVKQNFNHASYRTNKYTILCKTSIKTNICKTVDYLEYKKILFSCIPKKRVTNDPYRVGLCQKLILTTNSGLQ